MITVGIVIDGDRHLGALARALARVPDVHVVADRRSERDEQRIDVVRTSRIRPAFGLDVDVTDDARGRAATALGLSHLAWEGSDGFSFWQHCHAPLTARPLRGAPRFETHWLLVDECDHDVLPTTPLPGWQWHVVVQRPRALARHVVQWSASHRELPAVLGEATTIAGRPGPLVYDAWRLGKPVVSPLRGEPFEAWPAFAPPSFDPVLAHCIPPFVWQIPGFWAELIAECSRAVREGVPIAPWMRPEVLRAARERGLLEGMRPGGSLRRALGRFRLDPPGFLRDVRLWCIRRVSSRARPAGQRNQRSLGFRNRPPL